MIRYASLNLYLVINKKMPKNDKPESMAWVGSFVKDSFENRVLTN
jgi:hypothetical protein